MALVLTSVPHSGTQFFQRIVRPDRLAHVDAYRPEDGDLVVCVVRQPESVWRSWWNRREGLNGDNSGPGEAWWAAWERLKAMEGRVEFWLPIDHESRVKRLRALGKRLGRRFEANWSERVNEGLRYRGPEPRIDFGPIYDIPIIRELYG